MLSDTVRTYGTRLRAEFEAAVAEEYTPHQLAASFATGIFITALPTLGLGLGLFVILPHFLPRMSRIALFSSVVVLNPFVKPLVYAASYGVGDLLVAPEPVVLFDVELLDYAVDVTRRFLLGNILVALVLAATSYVIVRRLVRTYRRDRSPVAAR